MIGKAEDIVGIELTTWERDSAAIVDRIRSTSGGLKIVLKTKDDPFFISDWVAYHQRIVGSANIVIFDNGSSDPAVMSVYEALAPEILIVSFAGFHNNLHNPGLFPALYSSLASSCDFFCFLDTDEFLTLYKDGQFVSDQLVLHSLDRNMVEDFVPSTWLYNVPSYKDRLICGSNDETLHHCVRWGKPLIRSATENLPSDINHNCQIARTKKASAAVPGFFLFHMANLSPAQRIRVNLNKLIARGFIKPGDSVDKAVAQDLSHATENERQYVNEIRGMISLPEGAGSDTAPLIPGSMRIDVSGRPEFASEVEERIFTGFVESFEALCPTLLLSN
jgi:hypothetical protein